MFYGGLAAVATTIVFAGFARTYYLNGFFVNKPLTPLLHLHGVLFTSWLVLLVTQVSLVAANRTDIHRRLGMAGAGLAMGMVVVGIATAITAAKLGHAPPGLPPLLFLIVPLFDMVMFPSLVGAGFYFRRHPATHKRLMLLATLVLLPPAIARLPFTFIQSGGPIAFFGLPDLLMLGCIGYDTVTHRRLHPAFLWGGLALLLSHPLRLMISGTGAWMAMAQWLTR